jgi:hypothetical protein
MNNISRAALLAFLLMETVLAPAQDVLTWHNDNARTGQNLSEKVLTSQSGAGPAADPEDYIYLMAANGTFDTVLNSNGFPSRADFGNSFLRISTQGGKLAIDDYFTMFNVVQENASTAIWVMVLPDMRDACGKTRSLVVGAGKGLCGNHERRGSLRFAVRNNDATQYYFRSREVSSESVWPWAVSHSSNI